MVVGVIVGLSYQNPCLSPLDEFSRMKQQPLLTQHLADGKRIAHGTRAITKGGINCLGFRLAIYSLAKAVSGSSWYVAQVSISGCAVAPANF